MSSNVKTPLHWHLPSFKRTVRCGKNTMIVFQAAASPWANTCGTCPAWHPNPTIRQELCGHLLMSSWLGKPRTKWRFLKRKSSIIVIFVSIAMFDYTRWWSTLRSFLDPFDPQRDKQRYTPRLEGGKMHLPTGKQCCKASLPNWHES